MAQLYIATQTFMSMYRDRETWVSPGQIAEHGSWVLERSPGAFKPLTIDFPAPGSHLAAHKPPQTHPQPPIAEESPPSTAPDGGFIARTDGKKTGGNDDGIKPPATAPDGGFTAHGEVDPEREAKRAEPRPKRQPSTTTHKPARKG